MKFFGLTHFDFMKTRRIWYIASSVVIVLGVLGAFTKGVKLGIDFTGGTELVVRFENAPAISEIRTSMEKIGFDRAEIKTFGNKNDILIRTGEQSRGGEIAEKIRTGLQSQFPDKTFSVLKEDKIGPKIGAELRTNAIYAIIASLVIILIYVGFRFKFIFGVGGIVALIHDVLATFSIIVLLEGTSSYFNLEISQNVIAAFLTLVGFSINDTVVIFDRIRENTNIHRGETLYNIINKSINETLSRTMITNGTVFIVLLVLVIFGGEVNRGFALTFFIGSIFGTYSTVYIASAIVYDWSPKKIK